MAKRSGRIIELVLSAEVVGPAYAVLPSEVSGPTSILILPIVELNGDVSGVVRHSINFRVAFEPDNPDRRAQPYRECIGPTFPDGWKYGDPFDPSTNRLAPHDLQE